MLKREATFYRYAPFPIVAKVVTAAFLDCVVEFLDAGLIWQFEVAIFDLFSEDLARIWL